MTKPRNRGCWLHRVKNWFSPHLASSVVIDHEQEPTLAVAIQTRDTLRAAMEQLGSCIDVLQREVDTKHQKRGAP